MEINEVSPSNQSLEAYIDYSENKALESEADIRCKELWNIVKERFQNQVSKKTS